MTAGFAQSPLENPQTPREISRATAKLLRRYPEICANKVLWVVVFDISRSGMGRWNDWARKVVSDLISFVMVEGDRMVLIPFDCVVDPPRANHPGAPNYANWEITQARKEEIKATVAGLLVWRNDAPEGTAWVAAAQAGLKTTAAVKRTDPDKVAVCVMISDRDSSDQLSEAHSEVRQVAGVKTPGQSLYPIPKNEDPIVVFHAESAYTPPAGHATEAIRYMPPWEPRPGDLPLPTVPREPNRPVVWWLIAALLLALGLWLLIRGLALRGKVEVRWGFRDQDPSSQVTVELPPGTRRLIQASGEPTPDPFTLFADGATTPVQRKMVIADLGALSTDADGATLQTSEQYLLRLAGDSEWANQLTRRRGSAPVYLELRLASQPWPLTRQPIGLAVSPRGHDWRQQVILGGIALVLGLLIVLLAKPTQPPVPLPVTGTAEPTEPFCMTN